MTRVIVLGNVRMELINDDVLGTKIPQSIGNSWDINKEFVAGYFKIKPEQIKGKSTLEGIQKVYGVDFLKIVSFTNFDNFGFGSKARLGFKLEKDTLDVKYTFFIPKGGGSFIKAQSRMFFDKLEKKLDAKGKTKEIIIETFSTFEISYYKWEISNAVASPNSDTADAKFE